MIHCVYLGELRSKEIVDSDEPVHICRVHDVCTRRRNKAQIASCRGCKEKLHVGDENFSERFSDFLFVVDRASRPTKALHNLLIGRSAFLVGGGPSANDLPLERLNTPGSWALCVNNVAGHDRFHPQAFVCSDPPSKFHDGIWMDPGIMKFVPVPKLKRRRGRLRHKRPDGEFVPLVIGGQRMSACDAPNVWGFARRAWLRPDNSFFLDPQAAWGNHNAGVDRTGEEKTVCTMLIGIRLLYYMGVRKIFLLGIDFGMDPTRDLCDNYSFEEERDEETCFSNNRQFRIVNDWLCRMQKDGVFERFGLSIFNCNGQSRLRAFPYVPFDIAMDMVTVDVPQKPFDLRQWYKK